MFISSFKLKGRADKRLEIMQTIDAVTEQVLLQKGCLGGTCYQDTRDKNSFCLLNEWETQKDLDEYMQSRAFAVLLGIRTILADKPEIRVLVEECTYNCDANEQVQVH